MKLNRYNYEEFFILYLDNELDEESRREVDAFIQANPDLKAELDILLQSKLAPDADISFVDKGSLLRFGSSSTSLANYEERLISYIDNELTGEDREDVEKFVASHPAVQKELNLLQQTKLQVETIVFPGKESLYRKEEKARVISVRWMRIAAAAILLFAIGTTAIILLNKKGNNSGGEVVVADPKQSKPEKNTAVPKNESLPTPSNSQGIASTNHGENKNPEHTGKSAIAKSQNDKVIERKEAEQGQKNERALASTDVVPKPTNNLPTTGDQYPDVTRVKGTPTPTIGGDDPLPTGKEKTEPKVVTSGPTDTYINTKGLANQNDNPDRQFASENSGNKGLRGFLRKVTRTFEKRTNIKATDDDRLLIAGLAIKMN
jgi:hypothetical protein